MPASLEPALIHRPVLVDEVVRLLVTRPDGVYIDGTVGAGGHAEAILKRLAEMSGELNRLSRGRILGIDRDPQILDLARQRFEGIEGSRVHFLHASFEDMDRATSLLGVEQVDGLVLDLGVSSLQLDQAQRGFSFSKEAYLDMRMDPNERTTAAEIVAKSSPHELMRILRDYGEERFAARIVENIVEARRRKRIETTTELAKTAPGWIPRAAISRRIHPVARIHPATKTFQALRIAVNRELDRLDRFLKIAPSYVTVGGRIAVISYHSLEDRLVKQAFHGGEREGLLRRLTKKPIRPTDAEVLGNPRSRSARLRVAEKLE